MTTSKLKLCCKLKFGKNHKDIKRGVTNMKLIFSAVANHITLKTILPIVEIGRLHYIDEVYNPDKDYSVELDISNKLYEKVIDLVKEKKLKYDV